MQHYLAFDLGAESGRAILGSLENHRITLSEVHRFQTGMMHLHGAYKWNIYRFYEEMINGIGLVVKNRQIQPASIGIDTWGVDYGLFGEDGSLLDIPYCYRDHRTDGMMNEFFKIIPKEKVYDLTGIQLMQINTLFQLFSQVRNKSPQLRMARSLLFIPDIFNYFLTGMMRSEFSFATTSQLFNPIKGNWESSLFECMDLPIGLMQEIAQPGSNLGLMQDQLAAKTGAGKIPVISVASHDTGSAIAAIPAEGSNWAYISSGTWSLMGIESPVPIISPQTRELNITNEGGVEGTFRVLKNIMGLWLLQQCRLAWSAQNYTYSDLVVMASKARSFVSLIDPDDPLFLNPPDMPAAIAAYCNKTGQPIPETAGAFTRTILESLALKYRSTLLQIRQVSAQPIEKIYIIGGGVNNEMLCRFTANACGIPVITGPAEGTALGNLLVQAMAMGELRSLAEIRTVVRNSFPSVTYHPEMMDEWAEAYTRFEKL